MVRRRVAEKREQIFKDALGVATEIGKAEGLAGLTARQIASRVGCSVGTLYNVFGNLDTLILHLNGQTLDGLYDALSAVELVHEPAVGIQQLTESYRRYTTENINLWTVLFAHVWPADYVLPSWYPEKIQRLLGVLASGLQLLLPDADEADCMQAAAVLWSGLHGINSLAVSGKMGLVSSDSINDMTDLMVKSYVTGLAVNFKRAD
jgi:AcrR family transcriptional regulator